jgi:hypothetical protein
MNLSILIALVAPFAYCRIKVTAIWSVMTQQHCRLPLWCSDSTCSGLYAGFLRTLDCFSSMSRSLGQQQNTFQWPYNIFLQNFWPHPTGRHLTVKCNAHCYAFILHSVPRLGPCKYQTGTFSIVGRDLNFFYGSRCAFLYHMLMFALRLTVMIHTLLPVIV